MELTVREICGWSLTILGAVGSAAWAFMKWLHRGISRKLDKIDTLDATINSLKPKLEEFGETLDALSISAKEVKKEIDQRLREGERRFQEHELAFANSKTTLLESMHKAAEEARRFHDQANEDFVRKEELKANIVMVTGEYCNENCRDRKTR